MKFFLKSKLKYRSRLFVGISVKRLHSETFPTRRENVSLEILIKRTCIFVSICCTKTTQPLVDLDLAMTTQYVLL